MESPLIIFSHWIIFTRTTRLIDRIAVLCSILGLLFSGSWSGLHSRPDQSPRPFVAVIASKPPKVKNKLSSYDHFPHGTFITIFYFSEIEMTNNTDKLWKGRKIVLKESCSLHCFFMMCTLPLPAGFPLHTQPPQIKIILPDLFTYTWWSTSCKMTIMYKMIIIF